MHWQPIEDAPSEQVEQLKRELENVRAEAVLAVRAAVAEERERCAADRKDAERYRKLRAQNHTMTPRLSDPWEPGLTYAPSGLDAALDALPLSVLAFALPADTLEGE